MMFTLRSHVLRVADGLMRETSRARIFLIGYFLDWNLYLVYIECFTASVVSVRFDYIASVAARSIYSTLE